MITQEKEKRDEGDSFVSSTYHIIFGTKAQILDMRSAPLTYRICIRISEPWLFILNQI